MTFHNNLESMRGCRPSCRTVCYARQRPLSPVLHPQRDLQDTDQIFMVHYGDYANVHVFSPHVALCSRNRLVTFTASRIVSSSEYFVVLFDGHQFRFDGIYATICCVQFARHDLHGRVVLIHLHFEVSSS